MRDPKRIPEVLEAVRHAWEKYPDLRLGQLLSCAATGDPFYLEDDVLVAQLRSGVFSEAATKEVN